MRLIVEKAAQKGLRRMSANAASALLVRLEAIAGNPDIRHANVKPLTGLPDMFRLRQGSWRAVYALDRSAGEMHVIVIDVRGSVYR